MNHKKAPVVCGLAFLYSLTVLASEGVFEQTHFNIADYGAVGDGETLNTKPVQRAIDACTQAGGGTVIIPKGDFVSAPLKLKSNVRLFLSQGAILRACPDSSKYDAPRFIYASDCENIAISGAGTIHGNGIRFGGPGRFRPYPVLLQHCKQVRLQEFTIKDSAVWTLKVQACDYVTIEDVTILNDLRRVNNTDGIDLDGTRNARVSNCHIESGDDAIVIKSTNELGRAYPAENIVVTNCTIITRKTALKCGTESWNDFRNIIFSNCAIMSSARGLALWMRDGGTMENIMFSNITMDLMKIPGESVAGEPIRIVIRKRNENSKLGVVRNVVFDNLVIAAPYRCYIDGDREQFIDGVTISNVRWHIDTGVEKMDPAPGYMGNRNVTDRNQSPFDALFCSNIRDLVLDNISITWSGTDQRLWRNALNCQNAQDINISGFNARQGVIGSSDAAIHLHQVNGAFIHGCFAPRKTETFVKVSGENSKNIVLKSNALQKASLELDIAEVVDISTIHYDDEEYASTKQARASWPEEVTEVSYPSDADQTDQPAMVYAPEDKGESRPLLVALHTWSGDYRQTGSIKYAEWCIANGWFLIHPNFRGPNDTPQALGSDYVVRDILSAVEYMKEKHNIDQERIYLMGGSGGAHAALLLAGRAPQIWAAVSVWCPITDVQKWWEEKKHDPENFKYAEHIEMAVGGEPLPLSKEAEECRKRSPNTYLHQAWKVKLDINHGVQDGRTGSVPFTHSLNAFNLLCSEKDRLPPAEIEQFYRDARKPDRLKTDSLSDSLYGELKPVFRRVSGNARITIFDGGHNNIFIAGLNWLSTQRKNSPVSWEVKNPVRMSSWDNDASVGK